MISKACRSLAAVLIAVFCIAGPLALRSAGAANPAYACQDRTAKLGFSTGRPVCTKGGKVTDAKASVSTPDPVAAANSKNAVASLQLQQDAALHKLISADALFIAVLIIVGLVLLSAFLQFIGVGAFARKRAKLADVIARAPNVDAANANIADQMISPESARMIVQTSQTGLALVGVALLFFFGYLTFIYAGSFAPQVRPEPMTSPAADKPAATIAPKPGANTKSAPGGGHTAK